MSVRKSKKDKFEVRVQKNYPLEKLGIMSRGTAAYFTELDNEKELRELFRLKPARLPVYLIGAGSKIVASDGILAGLLLRLSGDFTRIESRGRFLCAGAAVKLPALFDSMAEKNLGGLQFLAGIPASVGGMIKKNAGCFGEEIMDYVSELAIFDGKRVIIRRKFDCGYRSGPLRPGEILLSATFRLLPLSGPLLRRKIREYIRLRKEKNLLQFPSVGSVFLNPAGTSAGALIDRCGLKGSGCGPVKVSQEHANFFVWKKGASASDFHRLYQQVRKKVKERTGVALRPEVEFWGSFERDL